MSSQQNIPEEFKKQIHTNDYETEIITLPSGGGDYYSIDNPLRDGKLELRLPTARDEDILASKSLIQKGVVIDVFLKSLVVDKNIDLDRMLIGDKNAVLFAARMLLYGNEYPVEMQCPRCSHNNNIVVDISEFETKELIESPNSDGLFSFELPRSKKKIMFRLFTYKDELDLTESKKKMKKYQKNYSDSNLTSIYKKMIVSVDGNNNALEIGNFIDNMSTIDSKAFRDYWSKVTPDIDTSFEFECEECQYTERSGLPITAQFFWPTAD